MKCNNPSNYLTGDPLCSSSSDEEYDPLIAPSFRFLPSEEHSQNNNSNDLSSSDESFDLDDYCLFEGTDLLEPTIMDSISEDENMDSDATLTTDESSDFESSVDVSPTPPSLLDLASAEFADERTPEVNRDASNSILGNEGQFVTTTTTTTTTTITVVLNPLVCPTLSQAFLQRITEAEDQASIYGTRRNARINSWPETDWDIIARNSFENIGDTSDSSFDDVDLYCYENIPPSP